MPATAEALARELARAVGSASVLSESEAALYAVDGRRPSLAVSPGTLEELSAALKLLSEAEAAVLPFGSGSYAEVGRPPRRYDVALLTARLNRVVEYEPDDLTAGVQAGVRFAHLQQQVAAHGQWLPLDPPAAERTTLGGLFASARVGPRRVSLGAPRDRVLGMTAVLADGTVVKSGGRVVKNVSGYDLHRLYTGSAGTLAVIAQVHVRLAARPAARRSLLFVSPSLEEAGRVLDSMSDAALEPSALDILDATCVRTAAARDASLPWRASAQTESWTVAALFEGDLELVEDRLQRTQAAAAARGKPIALEGDASDEFWRSVAELSAPRGSALAPDGRGHLLLHLACLPRETVPQLARWPRGTFGEEVHLRAHAHAGSGHVCLRLTGPSADALAQAWERIGRDLAGLEATAQVLDAPTALKERAPLWLGSAGPLALMKQLKDTYDPRGLLSPGRLMFDA